MTGNAPWQASCFPQFRESRPEKNSETMEYSKKFKQNYQRRAARINQDKEDRQEHIILY